MSHCENLPFLSVKKRLWSLLEPDANSLKMISEKGTPISIGPVVKSWVCVPDWVYMFVRVCICVCVCVCLMTGRLDLP